MDSSDRDLLIKNLFKIFNINLLFSLLIFIIMIIILKINRRFYHSYRKHLEDNPHALIYRLIYDITNTLIILITLLTVLQINGVNVTSLLAGLGIASVIGGLAIQDILRDIINGLRIISDNFFNIGDVVQYGGMEGKVISFNIRRTRIKSIKNDDIMTISNRNISEITLSSTLNDIDLQLNYQDNLERTLPIVEEIVTKIKSVPDITDCTFKGINEFAASAIIYKIRFFCPPEIRYEMRRTCHMIIKETLEAHHLAIPYEQLDIHLKNEKAA
ncbi:MAG: mechanosensitive ion channel family protein [bacterium]